MVHWLALNVLLGPLDIKLFECVLFFKLLSGAYILFVYLYGRCWSFLAV